MSHSKKHDNLCHSFSLAFSVKVIIFFLKKKLFYKVLKKKCYLIATNNKQLIKKTIEENQKRTYLIDSLNFQNYNTFLLQLYEYKQKGHKGRQVLDYTLILVDYSNKHKSHVQTLHYMI